MDFATHCRDKAAPAGLHRSKPLIHVNRHFRINQIPLDRLGKVGVHQ
jgi:hypothetical protein